MQDIRQKEAEKIWREASSDHLIKKIKPTAYRIWFADVKPFIIDNATFGLVVKTDSNRDNLIPYEDEIIESLFEVTKITYKLEILVRENGMIPAVGKTDNPKGKNDFHYEWQRGKLIPAYTFDNFIVGESNSFAHASCVAVASMKNPHNNNPLFLYGDSGLGKTHLLHAIGNSVNKNFPEKKVVYVQTEQFVNEFVFCIKNNSYDYFRNHYRSADLLLIDDVQFIEGKEGIQTEFFYTFNSLYELDKNVVLTSDKPPKNLKVLEDRLRTRFMSGLTVDISPPNYETRIAIVEQLCDHGNFALPHDIIEYMADNIRSNVRELEGAFHTLQAYARLDSNITLEHAKHYLRNTIQPGAVKKLTCDMVIDVVSHYFGISSQDIKSKKRNQEIIMPRQIAMYLCRENLNQTYKDIGASFGGKNHATVLHACDKMKNEIESDQSLQEIILRLNERL